MAVLGSLRELELVWRQASLMRHLLGLPRCMDRPEGRSVPRLAALGLGLAFPSSQSWADVR